ncbi:unnamed protein product, partial [Laminaria digitata]
VCSLSHRWAARMWSGAVPPPSAEVCAKDLQQRRDVRNAQPHWQFATGYLEIMEALAEVAGLGSTARNDLLGPDDGTNAACVNASHAKKSQRSVAMALFAEALAEISPDGKEEKGMLMLKEWLWSGPLLPCHYRIR